MGLKSDFLVERTKGISHFHHFLSMPFLYLQPAVVALVSKLLTLAVIVAVDRCLALDASAPRLDPHRASPSKASRANVIALFLPRRHTRTLLAGFAEDHFCL